MDEKLGQLDEAVKRHNDAITTLMKEHLLLATATKTYHHKISSRLGFLDGTVLRNCQEIATLASRGRPQHMSKATIAENSDDGDWYGNAKDNEDA